jgi:hypothetical protein
MADETCRVFRQLGPGDLQPGAIHRFVVGEDTSPRVLSPEQASGE